ncbi:flagellar basal body-associated protein FliL [Halobacteriovorax sp.]|uniref:flagellar basal body-associated FliL family protein n=1 Tax=Halobacteriovorax sp. TaxID=2020862 RepID=UPI003566E989
MTGNKLVDNIILILSFLATAVCVGVFLYTEMIYKKPLPNEQAELQRLLSDNKKMAFPAPFKLDSLIINLKARKTKLRFLSVETQLVPFNHNSDDKFEAHRSMINDSIINVAGRMTAEELNSVSGKILLEERIKKSVNLILGEQLVKGVLFTKFVVQ